MEYSRAIKNRRVRAATVLPALIGARTLALLNASGPAALQRIVKVARSEVRAMILSLVLRSHRAGESTRSLIAPNCSRCPVGNAIHHRASHSEAATGNNFAVAR